MRPETKYTKSGDVHIAYQVAGDGPIDLVVVPGFISHVEYIWEEPRAANFLRRLASFSRVIMFDKRGTGLSDRVGPLPTLEQRMDDVRAVMDAVGSRQAALFGVSEGGPMSLLFAATYPARTSALIIYGSYARRAWAPDHPIGRTEEEMANLLAAVESEWGGPVGIQTWAPTLAGNELFRQWWATFLRYAGSPGATTAVPRMAQEIDVRHVLPVITSPTLILHRTADRLARVEQARYMAERIAGAKLVESPGNDHLYFVGDADAIIDEIQEFLTGMRGIVQANRVLATVLFVDMVGSTERAAAVGDARWRDLLATYHAQVSKEVVRFGGRLIDTSGDGAFAIFDGPARAVRCAAAVRGVLTNQGLTVRSGLHPGECEVSGDKIVGIAVHIASRVSALAGPGEILVSNTVKDLVAGSGLHFSDRGSHTLKGVPGKWRVLAAHHSAQQHE
jgi:class 3 adenylate cyclase/pimeloyl-ACP methyl ester carboxylesterase